MINMYCRVSDCKSGTEEVYIGGKLAVNVLDTDKRCGMLQTGESDALITSISDQ